MKQPPTSESTTPQRLATNEFVVLMAMIISLVALSIDAMLPALPSIAIDLGVEGENGAQLVVSFMFLGYAVGQLIYGPLSDTIGRRPAIYAGIAIFVLGCSLSLASTTYPMMLAGRVLQGIGAASPRIVSVAMIRDQYEGQAMARITSMIMAVFIVVPAIAPAVGQGILMIAHWRAIFALLLFQALVGVAWLAIRQPETLPPDKRHSFSLAGLVQRAGMVCRQRTAVGYTFASGFAFGGFVGYLMSAQQIFQELYRVADLFPVYFGALALALGAASLVNSSLVLRFGMVRMCYFGLAGLCLLTVPFVLFVYAQAGQPPLWLFISFMLSAFFCVGLLFGNFSAMAMAPLGEVAGIGSAMVGSVSTVVSLVIGSAIGQSYDGTVLPLVGGMALVALASLATMWWTERTEHRLRGRVSALDRG